MCHGLVVRWPRLKTIDVSAKTKAWERVHRSYLACISWADYNIGRVLDALNESDHAENTIVVVWSDHGYHQGEKRSFRKFSLWEEATRVPFIIYDPRRSNGHGKSCDEAVSLIHVYRTLSELCGIDAPEYLDGKSLASLVDDPNSSLEVPAITTWGRGNYSVRDERYRYIRYFDGSEELYDHEADRQEWNNLASDSDHQVVVKRLANFVPKDEAPLVRDGISLWNVIDADRPGKLDTFREKDWPKLLNSTRPKLN